MTEKVKHKDTHTFVVPAFGESPFLSSCLKSLCSQAEPSRVLVCTSTPNGHIESTAKQYSIPVHVMEAGKGIGADWNAALLEARTQWVTLAHQDDVYLPNFSRHVSQSLSNHNNALLCFTAYRELTESGVRGLNMNMRVKHALINMTFLGSRAIMNPRRKLVMLALGSPIPCPSVTLNLAKLKDFRFSTRHRVNLDWLAWLELSQRTGSFVRIQEVLMYHRIHRASETSRRIEDGTRQREDLECFSAIWPRSIANLLSQIYELSYRSNHG